MATKTKVKEEEFKLHPNLDFGGGDPALVGAIMQGEELIVNLPMKRKGVKFERGDRVRLGDLENDGFYAKPHPTMSVPWVRTVEAWDFIKHDKERRDYEREVIEPLRLRLQWAAQDLGKADAGVLSLEAQLKQARSDQKQARNAKADIQKQLDAALAAIPELT